MSDAPSYQGYNHIDLVKSSNAEEGKGIKKQGLPFPWFPRHHLASASRSYGSLSSKADFTSAADASAVASISLPAISSSAVEAAVVGRSNNMNLMERISIRNRISPHLVLGKIYYIFTFIRGKRVTSEVLKTKTC